MKRTMLTAGSQKGMTLMELIVVISLIGLLSAIAVPPIIQWRQNTLYRTTTRDLVIMLRDARAKSIGLNRQHRVEFDLANRRYGLRGPGSRAYNTDWANLADNPLISPDLYHDLPVGINVNPSINELAFNSNGTYAAAATATVQVQDAGGGTHYTIDVNPSGRIRVH